MQSTRAPGEAEPWPEEGQTFSWLPCRDPDDGLHDCKMQLGRQAEEAWRSTLASHKDIIGQLKRQEYRLLQMGIVLQNMFLARHIDLATEV